MTKRKYALYIGSRAALACVVWSTAFVTVKIGLAHGKPLAFAGLRFMLAGTMIVPFCRPFMSCVREVVDHFKTIMLISFFQTFLLYGTFFIGMTMVPGGVGAIIIGSSPLLAALTAHCMMANDKITMRKIGSILLGVAGIVIISVSRNPWTLQGGKEFCGIVLLLFGCISSSVGNVIVSQKKRTVNPLVCNAAQLFLGGVGLLVVSLFVEGVPEWHYPLSYYAVLVWLAFIAAFSFSVWFKLLQRPRVKVSDLNVWKFIIPVSGALLSWLILPNESADLLSVVGMVCVAVSIVAYNRQSFRLRKTVSRSAILLLCVCLSFSSASTVSAEFFFLKDGTHIEGERIREYRQTSYLFSSFAAFGISGEGG